MESHRRPSSPDEGTEVELLGVAGRPGVTETTIHTAPPRRWSLGVATLLAVVVIGALVAANEGGNDDGAPTTVTPTTGSPTTVTPTTAPSPTATPTSATPTTVTPTTGTQAIELGDGPLLGEATGAWLLLTDRTLRAIDLDTGRTVDLGIEADRVWRRDDRLLLRRQNRLESLDLETFETVPLEVAGQVAADPAPPGQVWIRATSPVDGVDRLRRVDLATGAEVEARAVPPHWAQWGPWLDVQLVGSPRAGGVYRLEPDGVRRLLDSGVLLASLDGRHLVERCDLELACALVWIDDAGATDGSLVVPPDDFDAVRVLGTGAWIALERWTDGLDLTVFDAATGRTVDVADGGWVEDLVVSPDERWLLLNHNGRLDVLDLADPSAGARDVAAVFGARLLWLEAAIDLDALASARGRVGETDGAGTDDGS